MDTSITWDDSELDKLHGNKVNLNIMMINVPADDFPVPVLPITLWHWDRQTVNTLPQKIRAKVGCSRYHHIILKFISHDVGTTGQFRVIQVSFIPCKVAYFTPLTTFELHMISKVNVSSLLRFSVSMTTVKFHPLKIWILSRNRIRVYEHWHTFHKRWRT